MARLEWFLREFRGQRKSPGWFPALTDTTDQSAGALTVAGQWRSFTAFPSILAIKEAKKGMVTPGRLELPTRSLGNCCSIHLSYGATFRINMLHDTCDLFGPQLVTES